MFEIYQRYTPNQNNGQGQRVASGGGTNQNNMGIVHRGTNQIQGQEHLNNRQNHQGTGKRVSQTADTWHCGSNIKMLPPANFGNTQNQQAHKEDDCQNRKSNSSKKKNKGKSFFENLLPKGLYDPKTKKVMGFFTAEDLLLVALVFVFMESEEDGNTLMALALLYVLLGDYLDLGELFS